MARVLMVVAQQDYRDEELDETRQELERAGHACVVASQLVGPCKGVHGGRATADLALDDADARAFDATVFIGGPGARALFTSPAAHRVARQAHESGKVLGAICVAPTILANAGLLTRRRATVFHTEIETLEAKGVLFTGDGVTVDNNIVTASGPREARSFGRTVARLLATRARIETAQLHPTR